MTDFRVVRGNEIFDKLGDGSRTDGFLSTAARLGLDVVPAADYVAVASGPVEDAVVNNFVADVELAVDRSPAPIDALFIGLHGGMVSESLDDVEGTLLPRLRRMIAKRSRSGCSIPAFGVTDMHANVSSAMAANAALFTYHKNPHIDAYATAVRAAEVLQQQAHRAEPLFTAHYPLPVILAPGETGSAAPPLCELEALARSYESAVTGVVAVNVHAGFAYADIADCGVSIDVVSTNQNASHPRLISEAYAILSAHARRARAAHPAPAEVLAAVSPGSSGPLVIADPSDNVGAGAPGDTTGLLRAFMRRADLRSLTVLCDPQAVADHWDWPIGTAAEVSIGGRSGVDGLGPLRTTACLIGKASGEFKLLDRHSHMAASVGMTTSQGPTLVIQIGLAVVIVHSRRTLPFDLGQIVSLGLDPRSFDVIGVKAAVGHRQAYEEIGRGHVTVETPGCCPSDLRVLGYKQVRRPIFPLDPLPDFRI